MKLNKMIPLITVPLLLAGCSNQNLTFIDNPIAEYMSEDADACDFIVSYKGKEILQSERGNRIIRTGETRISCSEIDTTTIGRNKVYFDVDGKLSSLVVDVKDTTPPVITVLENVTSNKLIDYVQASDPSGVARLTCDGDFNPNVDGEYEVTATAEDNEGNIGTKTFAITVKNQKETVEDIEPETVEEDIKTEA